MILIIGREEICSIPGTHPSPHVYVLKDPFDLQIKLYRVCGLIVDKLAFPGQVYISFSLLCMHTTNPYINN